MTLGVCGHGFVPRSHSGNVVTRIELQQQQQLNGSIPVRHSALFCNNILYIRTLYSPVVFIMLIAIAIATLGRKNIQRFIYNLFHKVLVMRKHF